MEYKIHSTRYKDLSDDHLYSMYRESNYSKLKEDEKLDLVQETVNRDALERGEISAPEVRFVDLPVNESGNSIDGIININRDMAVYGVQNYEYKGKNIHHDIADYNMQTLNTAIHENVHCFQEQVIDGTIDIEDNIILGADKKLVFTSDSEKTGINNNILVVGSSGAGKTMSIVEPFLLETYSRNLVVSVSKRRIVDLFLPLLRERGYSVHVLDFVNPCKSDWCFDPLNYVNSYADITFLAKSLIVSQRREKSTADPFWDDAAVSLLTALITYVLMTKENPSFEDVLNMLHGLKFDDGAGTITTNYDDYFDLIDEKEGRSNFAVINFKTFCKLPIKTAGCVYSTLNSSLDKVFSPELCEMFSLKSKVDYNELATKKTIIFVITSAVDQGINTFINLFYTLTFKELFKIAEENKNRRLPIDVCLIADDAAAGCPIPMLDSYIAVFREKGISMVLLLQSEAQLNAVYGNSAAITIKNNCDSYVFMGGNDLETAQHIALRSDRPLLDILELDVGKELVFRRGMSYCETDRYNIKEDERYKQLIAEYTVFNDGGIMEIK